jgi:hypothetical protein
MLISGDVGNTGRIWERKMKIVHHHKNIFTGKDEETVRYVRRWGGRKNMPLHCNGCNRIIKYHVNAFKLKKPTGGESIFCNFLCLKRWINAKA